jgi:hypothetical protein
VEKSKPQVNPLLPLLDQEKHFFELTKKIMQSQVSENVKVYPLEKLDAAFKCLKDALMALHIRPRSREHIEELSQLPFLYLQTCKMQVMLENTLAFMLEKSPEVKEMIQTSWE